MLVIAEVGSNWKTHQDCIQSIRAAKAAGAGAVKFQWYTNECLYGAEGDRNLTPDIPALAKECEKAKIEFMCTAFSPKGYDLVDPYVKRHKVASSEITAVDILDKVNSFKKPVILSTGGAFNDEITRAVLMLRNVPVTLLYCEVEYPARFANFGRFLSFRKYFPGCDYGYSDHTIDVIRAPLEAKQKGASVIEKHVNFTDHTDTPDAGHSLSGEEFSIMVQALKGELELRDIFKPNPWKRQLITLPNGKRGWFRPLPNAG